MTTGPSYFANSPVSGTQYWAPMGYGCIPANGSSLTCWVKAWSGSNGTGHLVTASTLTAVNWDQTSNTQKTSFTGSGNNAVDTITSSFNGSDWAKPSGKYTGSGVGSLEMFLVYSGAAFIPQSITFTPAQGSPGTSVALSGSHFTDATSVSFNGTPASFTINSDSSITATVPAGATAGPISVGNQNGSGTSAASFEPGAIWIPVAGGGVQQPVAIWANPTGLSVVKVVGVWAPDGAGGVKRIW